MSFKQCVADGGKITTKSKKETYQRFCEIDGKVFKDRVRRKKK